MEIGCLEKRRPGRRGSIPTSEESPELGAAAAQTACLRLGVGSSRLSEPEF